MRNNKKCPAYGGGYVNMFISVNIPEGDFCNGCKFITPIINLHSEPKCIIFEDELRYVHRDKWQKCGECKQMIYGEAE